MSDSHPTHGSFRILGLVFLLTSAVVVGCSGDDGECSAGQVRACECQLENQVGVERCDEGRWEGVCTCTPVTPGGAGGGGGIGGGSGGGGGSIPDAGADGG
jgi:hypothetical protein